MLVFVEDNPKLVQSLSSILREARLHREPNGRMRVKKYFLYQELKARGTG